MHQKNLPIALKSSTTKNWDTSMLNYISISIKSEGNIGMNKLCQCIGYNSIAAAKTHDVS